MNQRSRETFRRANHMQRLLRGKNGDWLYFRESGPVNLGRIDLYVADGCSENASEFSTHLLAGPNGLLAESGAQGSATWTDEGDLAFGFVSQNEVVFCLGRLRDKEITWQESEKIPLPSAAECLLGTVRAIGGECLALPLSIQHEIGLSVTGLTLGMSGKWRTIILHEGRGAFAPFLLCGDDERFHLTWAQADECVFYLEAAWADLEKAAVPSPTLVALDGRQPILARTGKIVLLVYESHYSYPQSVLIESGRYPIPQHRVASSILKDDPRFAYAICHGLQLTIDHQGVPTLFFSERYRRQLFYVRWLGEGWGPILSLPVPGGYGFRPDESYLALANIAFEEVPPPEACDLGAFVEVESSRLPLVFFRYRPVEFICQEIQFLDCREQSLVSCFELRVNEGKKAEENQHIERGTAGSFNSVRAVNGGSFLKKENGWQALFRGMA
ncbi:MAG: hypothetical protein ACK5LK_10965, partial [Chthoniobacterales bacterium]